MSIEQLINGSAVGILFVFMLGVLKYLTTEIRHCERMRDRLERKLLE